MGLVKAVKSLLPNKVSAKSRAEIIKAGINQRTGKTAIKEAGKTARSIVSSIAANRTVQQKIASDAYSKYANNKADDVNKALNIYESIIKGNPEETGGTGTESTTNVGSSGSKLGG